MIVFDGVTYTYCTAAATGSQLALENVNLRLLDGEFIGIIGCTGSGKSTLVQHMNGLLEPTRGRVLLDGVPVRLGAQRFAVGLVFQYPEVQIFEQTVAAEISFGPKNMGLSNEIIARRVEEALAFVDLDAELADRSPFDLSGGQQRRLAIASILAMEPRVLVLDEPTAGLDPVSREEILRGISEYRLQKKATVVFVSHSMEEIAEYSDRVIVLDRGRVALDGAVSRVFAQLEDELLAGLDVPQVSSVFNALRKLGYTLQNVYTLNQAVTEILRLKATLRRR
ncbi:MAG: energy-coupling factor transporter ATPase [Oscillospiraceae bacterium]|jgi:energy-coupling factor transport system ATP-binding protein|nr:energy-coupling factor transporter ATPase [Oscillospiraceae bacterium]